MFTKWKFKRACRACKGPDYTNRISALSYLAEYRRKRKARKARITVSLTCTVAVLLFAVVFTVNSGKEKEPEQIIDNSILSEASESKDEIKYDKIIYSESLNYNGYSWARVNAGNVICDRKLQHELNNEENADSLFAVVVVLYDESGIEEVTASRLKILTKYTLFLKEFRSVLKATLAGTVTEDKLADMIINKKYRYELSEYEAVGGFNSEFFDSDTVATVYKVINATDIQLGDGDFLRTLDSELDYIFRDAGVAETDVTMWDIYFNKSYFSDLEWKTESDVEYFEALGIEITPLDMDEVLFYGSEPQKIYKTYLSKEQMNSIKGTKYGVYIGLQSKDIGTQI